MTSDTRSDGLGNILLRRDIHLRRDVLSAMATVAVAALLIALGLVDLLNGVPAPQWADALVSPWWHLVPVVAGGLAMLGERRRPLLMLGVGTVALATDFALGGSLGMLVVWWDLLYAVGLYASRRSRLAVTVSLIVVTVALSVVAAEHYRDLAQFLLTALQVGSVVLVPLWWAASVRQARELAAVADERARLEVERADGLVRIAELDRAEAVRAERTAMARDLHDVISSHLSAIAIHSGVALAAPADGERDRAALAQVRAASIACLDEMRTMINLLRSEIGAEPSTTQDGLSTLPALLRWAETSGLTVDADYPPRIEPALPTAIDQSALRVIREALTNALKHGAGEVHLVVRIDGDALTIDVRNRHVNATSTSGGGTGLVSMRERVVALDGNFTAGDDNGRWLVKASYPLRAAGQPGARAISEPPLGEPQLGEPQFGEPQFGEPQ